MRNYLTLPGRIRYCMTQQLFRSTFLKMSCQIKSVEKEKKQGLTLDRSLLLGFGGFEWSVSFSLSVTSSLSLPAARQCPRLWDPRCSLWSRLPEVTPANTQGAFKRMGKSILERDDLFFSKGLTQPGSRRWGGLLGWNQSMWSPHGASMRVEKAF